MNTDDRIELLRELIECESQTKTLGLQIHAWQEMHEAAIDKENKLRSKLGELLGFSEEENDND